jgi:hypothetical protein
MVQRWRAEQGGALVHPVGRGLDVGRGEDGAVRMEDTFWAAGGA